MRVVMWCALIICYVVVSLLNSFLSLSVIFLISSDRLSHLISVWLLSFSCCLSFTHFGDWFKGRWSDGASEWTPELLTQLGEMIENISVSLCYLCCLLSLCHFSVICYVCLSVSLCYLCCLLSLCHFSVICYVCLSVSLSVISVVCYPCVISLSVLSVSCYYIIHVLSYLSHLCCDLCCRSLIRRWRHIFYGVFGFPGPIYAVCGVSSSHWRFWESLAKDRVRIRFSLSLSLSISLSLSFLSLSFFLSWNFCAKTSTQNGAGRQQEGASTTRPWRGRTLSFVCVYLSQSFLTQFAFVQVLVDSPTANESVCASCSSRSGLLLFLSLFVVVVLFLSVNSLCLCISLLLLLSVCLCCCCCCCCCGLLCSIHSLLTVSSSAQDTRGIQIQHLNRTLRIHSDGWHVQDHQKGQVICWRGAPTANVHQQEVLLLLSFRCEQRDERYDRDDRNERRWQRERERLRQRWQRWQIWQRWQR